MKKAILVSKRIAKDNQSNSNVQWLTMYELPRLYKNKEGQDVLFYPKKDQALLVACISAERQPDTYKKLVNVREGAICMVTFGINEYTNKTTIANIDVVQGTGNIDPNILYKC